MTDTTTTADAVSEASPIVDKLDQIVDDQIALETSEREKAATTEEAKPAEETEIDESQEPQNKSYLNALAKAKGKMAKERFLRQEAEKRIAELEARKAPESKTIPDDGRPKEQDYGKDGKTWGDYARDLAKFEAKQIADENKKSTQEQTSKDERHAYMTERVEHAEENSLSAAKAFPDFKQIEADNMGVITSLPQTIKDLFLDSDNPSYAFYQLVKDGQLEELADVSQAKAALMIARAEDKALASKKPKTNAPSPLSAARGTAKGEKSLDQYSPDELRKWMRS
jgi:hypothetical protein